MGIIITALIQGKFTQLLQASQLQNYSKIENAKFKDWMFARLVMRERGRPGHEVEHIGPSDKATLDNIKFFFKLVNSFSYRPLTSENEFFYKLPVVTQNNVIYYLI